MCNAQGDIMKYYNPDETARKVQEEVREHSARELKPILTQLVENAAAFEKFTKELSDMFAGMAR